MSGTLQVELSGRVATVRLDRPGALNAITNAMAAELRGTLERLAADDAVGAVVLTGNGRGFCAGADLGDVFTELTGAGQGVPAARALEYMREHSLPLVRTLLEFDKPLVAAVNGPCAGAGVGLALAADVVVAAQDAAFTVVFARRGLVPDFGVTWLLPRLVGLRRARELCLLGERIPAADAHALGLVTQVVPGEELAEAADGWARRLAEGPAVALRLTKRLLLDSLGASPREAAEREFEAQALCFTTQDAVEGVSAFLEKREPRFTGR